MGTDWWACVDGCARFRSVKAIESASTVAAVRVPMTASYWLGVPTADSGPNFAKYTDLGAQYRRYIAGLVARYTGYGTLPLWARSPPGTPYLSLLAKPFGARLDGVRHCISS